MISPKNKAFDVKITTPGSLSRRSSKSAPRSVELGVGNDYNLLKNFEKLDWEVALFLIREP